MRILDGKVAIVTGTSRGVGVGIAHELLRAGATVVGCSRSPLDTIPGIDADWADPRLAEGLRSRRLPLDRLLRQRRRGRARPDRHLGQQRRRDRPGAARGEHSRTRATYPGRTAQRRRLRTHGTVSRLCGADEPDQSALVCRPRLPADGHSRRNRLHHQHFQRRRASGGITDPGLLWRGQKRAQPPHPVAGGGMGAEGPGQLCGARADHDGKLPVVRAAQRRSRPAKSTLPPSRCAAPANPQRWAGCASFWPAETPTSSTAPPSSTTAACCPACSTTPA